MTAINYLGNVALADLQTSDLVKIFSQKYGGEAAVSLSILASFINAQSTAPSGIDLSAQYSNPSATGFSVSVDVANSWLILDPTAGFAAGTITLPTATTGGEVLVNCTQSVTALTISAQAGDSVVGGPTTIAANGYFRLRYYASQSRWYRVG